MTWLDDFRATVIAAGADIQPATSEWEALRYKLEGKTGIVYRNKKNRLTATGIAEGHASDFNKRKPLRPVITEEVKAERRARTVELYTDASSYQGSLAAAWAAILVDAEGNEHEAHGPLKGEVTSSTAAEARAVANALHHFAKAGLINGCVRVICDNQVVVNALRTSRTKSKSPQIAEALAYIRSVAKGRFTIFAEWIKGHQPAARAAQDRRVGFNRRCDVLAKTHSSRLHRERLAP